MKLMSLCTSSRPMALKGMRWLSVQSKVLKYTARGSEITLTEETESIQGSPSGSQALIKFLASPVSHTDFKAIQSSGTEKSSLTVESTNVRFAKAQKFGPLSPTAGPIGDLPKLPAVGGVEGVAVVEAVGPSVKGLKPGDWVIPPISVGSWRTHAQVNESDLLAVPNNIPVEYAANLSISPLAALRLLEDFVSLKSGDVIIHNAANGLLGQTLIQLAVERGIKVVSVVRSRNRFPLVSWYLKTLGSSVVVPYEAVHTAAFREVLADLPAAKVAFDGVGGDLGSAVARALPTGATVVTFASASGQPLLLPAEKELKLKSLSLSAWAAKASKADKEAAIASLASKVKDGKLRLLFERAKFDSYAQALNRGFEDMRDRRITMLF
mmetsp:Transcript_64436/g.172562  ORF Transcript_64436/g.172562 Transcript_64436/m.172562 type:complete len:381 (+) Transcript_64436:41-1183(+)